MTNPSPPSPRPAVTVEYVAGVLSATWPAVAGADRYRVTVTDDTARSGGTAGETVYAADLDAATCPQPLVLTSPTFVARPGASYTVIVAVLGPPSDAATVTVIDLAAVTVIGTPRLDGFVLTWPAVTAAATYVVDVTDGGGAVVWSGTVPDTSIDLVTGDGLAPDTAYSARVRAQAGRSFGPWSAPVAVTIRSAAGILATVAEALSAAAVADTDPDDNTPVLRYPLAGGTLPATVPGAEAIRDLLVAALGTDVSITTPSPGPGPVLADTTLTLSGTSLALATSWAMPADLVFTVAADTTLRARWTGHPPPGWRLGDGVAALGATNLDMIPVTGPVITVVSAPDPTAAIPLATGLNLQVTVTVRGDLRTDDPTTTTDPPVPVYPVTIGGPVNPAATTGPILDWTANADLPDLLVVRIGQADLAVAGTGLRITAVGGDAPGGTAVIVGSGDIGGGTTPLEVGLPGTGATVRCTASDPQQTATTAQALVTAVGITDIAAQLVPASLLALSSPTLRGYTVDFDPAGYDPTVTVVTLDTQAPWDLATTLALPSPQITVTLTDALLPDGTPRRTVTVDAQATLSDPLSGTVAVGLYDNGFWYDTPLWYIAWNDTAATAADPGRLGALSALAGIDATQVRGVLPAAIGAAPALSLTNVAVIVDSDTAAIREVVFTIGQTQPWPIPGSILTLSGWQCTVRLSTLATPDWTVTGVLAGTITLAADGDATPPALGVELSLPVADGMLRLALVDGPVHIPAIGDLLGLLGAAVTLPTGIATLGDLDVTAFAITLDIGAGQVTHLSFAFDQSNTWTIIEGLLAVTDVAAALGFSPATPSGAWGQLDATVTVGGVAVHLGASKSTPADPWTLTTTGLAVPVPDFSASALEPWLAPVAARAALPATMPLSSGIQVGPVSLRFGGAGGSLDQVAFVVVADDVWTVIPDRFALTDLRADITVPFEGGGPVAATVSGTVAALLTLANVGIVIRASKPATGPWTFSGALTDGLTLDLLAAADAVSGTTGWAVPADAASHGLPASITLTSAAATVTPDTGVFHAEGSLDIDWTFTLGNAAVSVTSLTATIDIAGRTAPTLVRLRGQLTLGDLIASVGLAFGTADTPTILTGTVAAADITRLHLDTVADDLRGGTSGDWSTLVPDGLVEPVPASAALYLDLSHTQLLLYGAAAVADPDGQQPAAAFLLYAATPLAENGSWTYAFAAALGPGFTFARFLPAAQDFANIDAYLHVTDVRIVICDLRDPADPAAPTTLATLARDTTSLLAAADPAASAPLNGLDAAGALGLTAGCYLLAAADLSTGTLFPRLLDIGDGTGDATVRLSALIDVLDPTQTVFTADLPPITVLQTITLGAAAGYPGIHLSYRPNPADQFTLHCQATVRDIFGTDLSFNVTLTVDTAELTTSIAQSGPPGQHLANPFGIPGIDLTELAVTLHITWADPDTGSPQHTTTTLRGTVRLGPAPEPGQPDQRLSVAATVALVGGTPALFDIALTQDFAIGEFLAQCLTGDAATWPSDFLEITFGAGTDISYYNPSADPGDTLGIAGTHATGFSVDAQITLTIAETPVHVHGLVAIARNPASGAYDTTTGQFDLTAPIDLGFLAFAGPDSPTPDGYTGGPILAFHTGTDPDLTLATGVNFFATAFGSVSLTVRRPDDGGTSITGHLSAATAVEPFGTPSFAFTYASHPGADSDFTITDWPAFDWVRDLVDFAEQIKEIAAASQGLCGTLISTLVAAAYTATFHLAPSMTLLTNTPTLHLTGSYSLTLAGADQPFLTVDLKLLSIGLDPNRPWSEIPDQIVTGFADSARAIITDLLEDPQKAATLLVMLFGDKAVGAGVELACDGAVDGSVAGATSAGLTAVSEAGGPLAAGAVTALSAAILAYLADSGDDGDDGDPTHPAVPTLRSFTYADDTFTGSWEAATFAAGYTFEISNPDASVLGSVERDLTTADGAAALSATLAVADDTLPAGTFTGHVRSRRGEATSAWSTSRSLTKLASPPLTLTWQASVLTATWTTQPDAAGYAVTLTAPDGSTLTEVQLPANATTTSVDLDPVAGTYHGQLRTLGGDIPATPAPAATLDIVVLTAPGPVDIALADAAFTISWQPIGDPATGYKITLSSAAAPDPLRTLHVDAATRTTTIPAAATPTSGERYTAAVRALGTDTASPWATTTLTVQAPPAPTDVTLTYDGTAFHIRWNPATATPARYDVQLRDLSGPTPDTPVATATGPNADPAGTTLNRTDGTAPQGGERYAATVRTILGTDTASEASPWSEPAELVVTSPPPALSDVVLQITDGSFLVTWQALTDTTDPGGVLGRSYDVDILEDGGETPAASATAITATTVTLHRSDGAPIAIGVIYAARARARHGDQTGLWTVSTDTALIDSITITQATYGDNQVTVGWTPTTIAGAGYDAFLTVRYGGIGEQLHGGTVSPPPQTSFNVSGQPHFQTATARVRVWWINDLFGPWSPPVDVVIADAPTGLALTYDGTTIRANWNPVTDATSYHLALILDDNPIASVTARSPSGPPPTATAFATNRLQPGATYRCGIVAQTDTITSTPAYDTITIPS